MSISHSIEDTILSPIENDHLFLEDIREIADWWETLQEIHLKAKYQ